ncbi:radical SAM protein [Acidithiobacillus sulfuriphilus]|uniref:radical SAM protein n=1 Tax=Acidithiobacillus sulfuriphilus TaxID=1867749 RepID=UPI003F62B060
MTNITIDQAVNHIKSLFISGDKDGAVRVCDELVALNPGFLQLLWIRCCINISYGNKEKAKADAEKIFETTKDDSIIATISYYLSMKDSPSITEIEQQVNYERMRRSVYMDYPQEVSFETYTKCNAACSFCPYPSLEREGEKMSDELVDKILSELSRIPKNIDLVITPHVVNDPLIDKRMFSIYKRINDEIPNAKIRIFTNGAPLTDSIIDKLAEVKNVLHLWVSLNTHVEDEYEKLMKMPFFRTIDHLDNLHKKKESGFVKHDIVISKVSQNDGTDQDFFSFVKKRWPLFNPTVIGLNDWAGEMDIKDTAWRTKHWMYKVVSVGDTFNW